MNGTLHLRKKPDSVETELSAAGDVRPAIPENWVKGQLLNVRDAGSSYRVTLLNEEYDPRNPERCVQFNSSWEAQQFVSEWYSRGSHDPRAI